MNIPLAHRSIRKAARITFSRSGGPGGQNVNKVNTRVTLRLALNDLAGLSEAEAARLREQLAPRLAGNGDLVIASDEERSQRINRERAYARAEALIAAAARLPKKRRPSRPSKAAEERRLRAKRIRGDTKTGRAGINEDGAL